MRWPILRAGTPNGCLRGMPDREYAVRLGVMSERGGSRNPNQFGRSTSPSFTAWYRATRKPGQPTPRSAWVTSRPPPREARRPLDPGRWSDGNSAAWCGEGMLVGISKDDRLPAAGPCKPGRAG